MAEQDLPTSIQIQEDSNPPEATLTYDNPERNYHVRASMCEWDGDEEIEWLVNCTRPRW